MLHRLKRKSTALLFLLLSACGTMSRCTIPAPLDDTAFNALYDNSTPVPTGRLNVFHLGHSLVGKDMPAMLMQLAGGGHSYASQLGWGSFMREHWEPDVPIKGFVEENTHPEHRDPHEAIESGEYDAFVLTEAVEIRASVKYFASPLYLHRWAKAAESKNPGIRIYFYETWHPLDDPEGWLARLDRDLGLYWEGEILRRALNYEDNPRPIYMIPAGQVMARFVRVVEARGGIGLIKTRHDLFSDNIHFNDLGAYLVALTHYAVLYQKSPVGLPHALIKADGTAATDPGPEVARLMQETVWQIVTGYRPTGVLQ